MKITTGKYAGHSGTVESNVYQRTVLAHSLGKGGESPNPINIYAMVTMPGFDPFPPGPTAPSQVLSIQHHVVPVGELVRVVCGSLVHVALDRALVGGVPTANGSIV